ncbi:MAG: glutamate racemase [Cyanobacteria bacterium P01_A01_bin.84]
MFLSSNFEGNFYDLSDKQPQRSPIGVFDSGVGGLTVLRELYRQIPNESMIYFGDTARLPYGSRSKTEIIEFVRDILKWMQQKQVKMVIMACNTSSALALETVRSEFPFPILGIILPAAKAAVSEGKKVGVISTLATAKSNAYKRAINEIDPNIKVFQVGCPEFVPLIEQNRIQDPYTLEVAQSYIEPLIQNEIDTLIYGCTHYPHLAPIMRSLLPTSVKILDPAVHVVASCAQELDFLNIRNEYYPLPTHFAVSGCPQQFSTSCLQLLGYSPMVKAVDFTNHSFSELQQDFVN